MEMEWRADGAQAQTPDRVREVLRAYLDAVALIEPYLFDLWTSSGLTLTQMRVLRAVARGEACSYPSHLAREVGLSASALTRLLERMERRGFLTRRHDPSDRRRVIVELTEEGRSVMGDAASRSRGELKRAAAAMSPEEQERFVHALRSFVAAAQRLGETEEGAREAASVEVRNG